MTVPLPDVTDPEFAPYFEGCGLGELRVQQCHSCGARRWPPRPLCVNCGSAEFSWTAVPGRGRIYSFIVVHRAEMAAFADRVPYTVVIVENAEDPAIRFLGNLVGSDPAQLEIGQPVEVVFTEIGEGVIMPNWKLSGADDGQVS